MQMTADVRRDYCTAATHLYLLWQLLQHIIQLLRHITCNCCNALYNCCNAPYRRLQPPHTFWCTRTHTHTNTHTHTYTHPHTGSPQLNTWASAKDIPTETDIAIEMSKDMKRRGFKFVGPKICYSLMQSCGLIIDHPKGTHTHKHTHTHTYTYTHTQKHVCVRACALWHTHAYTSHTNKQQTHTHTHMHMHTQKTCVLCRDRRQKRRNYWCILIHSQGPTKEATLHVYRLLFKIAQEIWHCIHIHIHSHIHTISNPQIGRLPNVLGFWIRILCVYRALLQKRPHTVSTPQVGRLPKV